MIESVHSFTRQSARKPISWVVENHLSKKLRVRFETHPNLCAPEQDCVRQTLMISATRTFQAEPGCQAPPNDKTFRYFSRTELLVSGFLSMSLVMGYHDIDECRGCVSRSIGDCCRYAIKATIKITSVTLCFHPKLLAPCGCVSRKSARRDTKW